MIIRSQNKKPHFILNLADCEVPRESVKEISVTLSIVAMSEMRATISTHRKKLSAIDFDGCFKYGAPAKVSMGYYDDCEPIFTGILVYADPAFPKDGEPTLTLVAYDDSAALKKSGEQRNFNNKMAGGLVKEVLDNAKIGIGKIDDDVMNFELNERVLQGDESDAQIISVLSEEFGKFFWVDKGLAYFMDPTRGEPVKPSLVYNPLDAEKRGTESFLALASFSPGLKIYDLYYKSMTKLETMSDDKSIEDSTDKAPQPFSPLGPRTAPSMIEEAIRLAARRYYLKPITEEEFSDAKKLAELLANREFLNLVQGEGALEEGYNKLRAGEIRDVTLHNFPNVDSVFSGKYLISEVTHTINDEGYSTSFRFLRNALND